MAWDKTKPANTEKIRNLGSVIRDNWQAIEENDTAVKNSSLNQWVIHLIDRSTIGGSNTPARIDDIGMLYCRDDGSNNELYFQDSQSTANEIQLTEDGKLGSSATQVVAQNISFGSATTTNSQNAMATAWGFFSSTGATVAAYNLSCTRNSTGKYTLTFSTPLQNSNYAPVAVTRAQSGGSQDNNQISIQNSSTTYNQNQFSVVTRTSGGSPSLKDSDFFVAVFGGQV